ncbi:MAG TPA: hypothetical protein VHV78_04435 [Gemmatimonadaceae bacterium]|jgi:hypothetical protein|nr:hypothetical protein [Gemmatimonadaceae bacterium]
MRLHIRVEQLVVETFSVVLGILLALAANTWHDSRAHAAQARDALVGIRAEVAANRVTLDAKLGYHVVMHDSLDALVARTHGQEPPGGLLAIKGWNGISPPRLVDNAWQAAAATGAMQHIPAAMVLQLAKTYSLQRRVDDIQRAFFSIVYTPQFALGGVGAIASMASFLGDLSVNENHLLAQYDTVLVGFGAAARIR